MTEYAQLIDKYLLAITGWFGLLIGILVRFSVLPDTTAITTLLVVSGIAAIYGHHAISMGRFKQGDN